jgi:tetratricopeptide (TPR) repeat protein
MKKKRRRRIPRSRPLPGQEEKKPMDPWDLADWRHAGLAAATMFPFGAPKPTPEQMVEELREILDGCPDYYPALFNLGNLAAAAGRTEEARQHLLDAADRMAERERHLEPDLVELVDGITHRLKEDLLRYDLARDLLERLAWHYPEEPAFRSDLGAALVLLGDFDEAVRQFQEAIALAPEDHRHHSDLGWAYLEMGRLKEAKPPLKRALQLHRRYAQARGNLKLLSFLKNKGGTFEDYLARPMNSADRETLEYETLTAADVGLTPQTVRQWNHDRMEAWRRHVCRTWQDPGELELFKSVRAFFTFLEELDFADFVLYEDVVFLDIRFESVFEEFILRMSDADEEILEEVCDGLLAFYSYLARKGVVDQDHFADFQSRVHEMKPTLVEKAQRFAAARHDPSLTDTQMAQIRWELFGDL